ncbi:MAG: CinA family protein [Ilumatobacteraceae bacterium]|nr:CinA family protein [Acidimicrobiales bacterium]MCB9393581.1 CinA family protein [Acidimicrobiaceae bacterium]
MTTLDDARAAAERLVRRLLARNVRVATAESLTGGLASHVLVDVPDSGEVHLGGVVAYDSEAKRRVLGVGDGPVVSGRCAQEMAAGVQRLFGAPCAIAFTGVAGPAEQEGLPVGTVFIAARAGERSAVVGRRFDGDPDEIRLQAVCQGVDLLTELLGG